MKRLRIFFAATIIIFALPAWRYIDFIAIASPFAILLTLALTIWFIFFIAVPIKLLRPSTRPIILAALTGFFAAVSWFTPPVSQMATVDPEFNHCGSLTFTGTFYPLRTILTDAYHDDLEVRNQLCWVRKMISKVPATLTSDEEIMTYSKIIEERLLKPERKYRASLPLIAVLYIRMNGNIYQSLHFWKEHYTEEINLREYSIWNFPHSEYIKFEYGLIERNWQTLTL